MVAPGLFYFECQLLPQCQRLQDQVGQLLGLLGQEPSLRTQVDTTAVQTSLRKAIASTFEIVFAGAFSAGDWNCYWRGLLTTAIA